MVVLLLGAALSVPWRWVRPPEPSGFDQPRAHFNTKNSTRFLASDLATTADLVARAVYPGTTAENSPSLLLFYDDDNWQAGLKSASLLRPLNALLLPSSAAAALPDDFDVSGSEQFGGAQALLIDDANIGDSRFSSETISSADVQQLLQDNGANPQHAVVVDPDDPATAILAAPWAAYSGDLILFEGDPLPQGMAAFLLGPAEGPDDLPRIGTAAVGDAAAANTAVAFATYEADGAPLFGWSFNAESLTGYRGFVIAPQGEYGLGLLGANLARRGKPGPLFWSGERELPQAVYNYFFSQRAAFWVTPSEGPFHHFYILGGLPVGSLPPALEPYAGATAISFPAQGEADYSVEIGPYFQKGIAAGPMDMLAAAWVLLGVASAVWIAVHEARFLPVQNWLMKLAWPLLAMMIGPFGIPLYKLAHKRPIIRKGKMLMWDRPLWLQGLAATASAVGFGGLIMVTSGYLITLFGMPLIPLQGRAFLLGTPMILVMIINYVAAVVVAWLIYQTPMMAVMYGTNYRKALPKAFPLVAASMLAAAIGMNPTMWWMMMAKIPMMPTEESILWFGTMFFTVFVAFLVAWPLNYTFVRAQRKAGLM